MGPDDDRDLFVGATIPKDIQMCIKRLPGLSKQHFRKILQALVASMEGGDFDSKSIPEMISDKLTSNDLDHIYSGLLSLLQHALRLPQTSLKQQVFQEDLHEMKIPEEFIADLTSVVFGSKRPSIEDHMQASRPRLPTLERLKWRVDVAISTSVLNRALEPTVFMETKLSNGKVHKFEVPVAKFSELRYNVAYVLKEMEQLEKRSILKIQN